MKFSNVILAVLFSQVYVSGEDFSENDLEPECMTAEELIFKNEGNRLCYFNKSFDDFAFSHRNCVGYFTETPEEGRKKVTKLKEWADSVGHSDNVKPLPVLSELNYSHAIVSSGKPCHISDSCHNLVKHKIKIMQKESLEHYKSPCHCANEVLTDMNYSFRGGSFADDDLEKFWKRIKKENYTEAADALERT